MASSLYSAMSSDVPPTSVPATNTLPEPSTAEATRFPASVVLQRKAPLLAASLRTNGCERASTIALPPASVTAPNHSSTEYNPMDRPLSIARAQATCPVAALNRTANASGDVPLCVRPVTTT